MGEATNNETVAALVARTNASGLTVVLKRDAGGNGDGESGSVKPWEGRPLIRAALLLALYGITALLALIAVFAYRATQLRPTLLYVIAILLALVVVATGEEMVPRLGQGAGGGD